MSNNSSEEDHNQKCINELKQMILEEMKLKYLLTENDYLIRYLKSTNYDAKAAFEKLKEFYELLQKYPEWFPTKCPSEKRAILERDIRIVPGGCDKEGRLLYIVKVGNLDPSRMDLLEDIVPIEDIWAEYYLSKPESIPANKGICLILDIANFSWKLMKYATPHNIVMGVHRVQSMPIKDVKYHVVNDSFLIHAAIKIVWMFLPQYIKDSTKFHFSDRNSLYQYVDKEELPPEYGGYKKVTYTDCNQKVFQEDLEISENLTLYRKLYLENISHNKNKKK